MAHHGLPRKKIGISLWHIVTVFSLICAEKIESSCGITSPNDLVFLESTRNWLFSTGSIFPSRSIEAVFSLSKLTAESFTSSSNILQKNIVCRMRERGKERGEESSKKGNEGGRGGRRRERGRRERGEEMEEGEGAEEGRGRESRHSLVILR